MICLDFYSSLGSCSWLTHCLSCFLLISSFFFSLWNDYGQILEGKMCCSVLGGDGYSDCITDVTHQSKNALGILTPDGWRKAKSSQHHNWWKPSFLFALGSIHSFFTKYTAHILSVGIFYSLKIKYQFGTLTFKLSQGLTVRLINKIVWWCMWYIFIIFKLIVLWQTNYFCHFETGK